MVVLFADLAGEDEDKLCKRTPLLKVCNNKIVSRMLGEVRTTTQVICFDPPIDQRLIFHLDESIFGDLDKIRQV